jgi:hypothetical protein
MQMRTTLNIDSARYERARQLTGIPEKTALLNAGLDALIQLHSSRRLAALGGSEPAATAAPRRRAGKQF